MMIAMSIDFGVAPPLANTPTPLKKQPVSNVAENTVYVYPLEIYVFVSNIQFSRG